MLQHIFYITSSFIAWLNTDRDPGTDIPRLHGIANSMCEFKQYLYFSLYICDAVHWLLKPNCKIISFLPNRHCFANHLISALSGNTRYECYKNFFNTKEKNPQQIIRCKNDEIVRWCYLKAIPLAPAKVNESPHTVGIKFPLMVDCMEIATQHTAGFASFLLLLHVDVEKNDENVAF